MNTWKTEKSTEKKTKNHFYYLQQSLASPTLKKIKTEKPCIWSSLTISNLTINSQENEGRAARERPPPSCKSVKLRLRETCKTTDLFNKVSQWKKWTEKSTDYKDLRHTTQYNVRLLSGSRFKRTTFFKKKTSRVLWTLDI